MNKKVVEYTELGTSPHHHEKNKKDINGPKEHKITLESYLKIAKNRSCMFYLPVPIGLIKPLLPAVALLCIMGLILWTGLNGSLWLEL